MHFQAWKKKVFYQYGSLVVFALTKCSLNGLYMIFWSFLGNITYSKDNFCFKESIYQWHFRLISNQSEFCHLFGDLMSHINRGYTNEEMKHFLYIWTLKIMGILLSVFFWYPIFNIILVLNTLALQVMCLPFFFSQKCLKWWSKVSWKSQTSLGMTV